MLQDIIILIGELLGTDNQTSLEILIILMTIIVGFLIILFATSLIRKSSKKTIYLMGISDSGKTQLFSHLVTNGQTQPVTVTSQVSNIYENYTTDKNHVLRLIDIPGADKVRSSSLTTSLSKFPAAGLIYVIDSAQVVKDCREIAECLYGLLADFTSSFGARKFPVLIACNKQDLPASKAVKVVKSILEKEFALLNRTRAAALDQTSGSGTGKNLLLGGGGERFNFEELTQKVHFVECISKNHSNTDANVDDIKNWLNQF